MIALKVWSCERSVKRAVIILGDLTIKTALKEASKKLGYQGQQLVLESDGTLIDDDMILEYFKDQVILLLKDEEEWSPPIAKSPNAHSTFRNSTPASPTYAPSDSENSPSFSLISCISDTASQKKRMPLSNIDLNVSRDKMMRTSSKLSNSANLSRQRSSTSPVISEHLTDTELSEEPTEDAGNDTENEADVPQPENKKPKQQPKERALTSHDSYKVPFHHLQQDIASRMNAVKNQSIVLRRKEYRRIKKVCLNFVVGEMRFINASLRKPSLERVAKKLRDWHPTFFEDRCNGEREGSGIATTVRIMRDHNNYLNRLKRQGDKKKALTIPISKRKLVSYISSGCSNWSPRSSNKPDDEIIAGQLYLKGFSCFDLSKESISHKVLGTFRDTFPAQRLFINKLEDDQGVDEIMEEWPCLFDREYLLRHYSLLTNVSADLIMENLRKNRTKILTYGINKQIIRLKDVEIENRRNYLALYVISNCFNENFQDIVQVQSIESRKKNRVLHWSHDSPRIEILQGIPKESNENAPGEEEEDDEESEYEDGIQCYLKIEDKRVFLSHDFDEVIPMLICSYFVFNKLYPKQCGASFEFMQMFLANVFTDDKARSRSGKMKEKAHTLHCTLKNLKVADYLESGDIRDLESDLHA